MCRKPEKQIKNELDWHFSAALHNWPLSHSPFILVINQIETRVFTDYDKYTDTLDFVTQIQDVWIDKTFLKMGHNSGTL